MTLLHASCVASDGEGVLLLGPPGAGKSDLALRLMEAGFGLVADDQVWIDGVRARPAPALAGLLEVRGLGIMCVAFVPEATLRLAVHLSETMDRLPEPARLEDPPLPLIRLNGRPASAALRVRLALDCAMGRATQRAGAFVRSPT